MNTTEVIYDYPIPVETGPTLTDKLKYIMKEKLGEAAEFAKEEYSIGKEVAKENLPIVMELAADGLKYGLAKTGVLAAKGLHAAKEGILMAADRLNLAIEQN